MLTAAKNKHFFIDSFSFNELVELQAKHGRFYQQIVSALIKGVHKENLAREVGDKLVVLAEQAHAFRRMDALGQVTQALLNWPLLKEHEAIGNYYQAIGFQNRGRGNIEEAARFFECVSEDAPLQYRLKAIVSLGANRFHEADYQSALSLYYDAGRFALHHDLYDTHSIVHAQRMIAVINSIEGNHRDAVKMLETLFPLAHALRFVQPHVYYDYLNSFAVELGEVGRLEEANNICQIALASPYAKAYPEWHETLAELNQKAYRTPRSVVSLAAKTINPENVVQLPERELPSSLWPAKSNRNRFQKRGTVTYLKDWKRKMVKESNGNQENDTVENLEELTDREMMVKIIKLLSQEGMSEDKLRRILEAVIEITSEKKERK